MPTEKEFLAKKALLDTKQDKLVAGTNIQIDPVTNRISAINDAEIIDVQVNGQSVLGVDKIARVNVDTVEPNPTSTPTDTLTSVDINGIIYELQGGGGDANYEELTQAEYDALTPEEKMNGTIYFITDAQGGGGSGGSGISGLDWNNKVTVTTSVIPPQGNITYTPTKPGVLIVTGYGTTDTLDAIISSSSMEDFYVPLIYQNWTSSQIIVNANEELTIANGSSGVAMGGFMVYFIPIVLWF